MLLNVSEGRLLQLDQNVTNVLIGDHSIADVQVVSPRELYIYGRKPGQTTLSATSSDNGIAAQLVVRVQRNGAAAQAALPVGSAVSVGFEGNRLVVRGPVADLGQALETQSTAQAFNAGKLPPLDRTQLAGAQQVTLRVRIAEVSRSTINELGLNLNVLANPGTFMISLVTGSFLGESPGQQPDDLADRHRHDDEFRSGRAWCDRGARECHNAAERVAERGIAEHVGRTQPDNAVG